MTVGMPTASQIPMAYPRLVVVQDQWMQEISIRAKVIVTTVFFYNYVLTFGDEINYVWLTRWNIGTVIFVLSRYLTATMLILTLSIHGSFDLEFKHYFLNTGDCHGPGSACIPVPTCSEKACNFVVLVRTGVVYPTKALFYSATVVAFCCLCLLQIRAYTLYNKSRTVKLLFFIVDIFVIIEKVLEATMIRDIRLGKLQYILIASAPATGLSHSRSAIRENGTNIYTPFFWLPFAFAETITFVLVIWNAVPTSAQIKSALHRVFNRSSSSTDNIGIHTILKRPKLIKNIVQDGIVYFFSILVVYTAGIALVLIDLNSFCYTLTPFSQLHLLISMTTAGILGPHIYLKLKKQYHSSRIVYADSCVGTVLTEDHDSTSTLSSFFAITGSDENADGDICADTDGMDADGDDPDLRDVLDNIELSTFLN